MAIVKKANQAEWDALSKSTTESTIGLLTDTNKPVRNGVNVEVQSPEDGDLVFYDSSKKVHFIALETHQSTPADWTWIGVVAHREGNRVYILHKATANKKWAEVFQWSVTGDAMTDGVSHTATIMISADEFAGFTWQTSNVDDFAAALNTFLEANHPTDQPYSCYVDTDGTVIVQQDNYTTYKAVTITGLTCTAHVGTEIGANQSAYKINGVGGEGGIVNMERALVYFRADSSSTIYNPSVEASLTPRYPICLPAYLGTSEYQSDHCSNLRAKYGQGEEGWLKFMEDMRVKYPAAKGILEPQFRDGKASTYKLAGVTYLHTDGTRHQKYPAAEYCAACGYSGVKGLEPGDWFLPSADDLLKIWPKITYSVPNSAAAAADRINRALQKMGGSQLSNGTYAWTSSRYYTYVAWIFNGNYGYLYSGNFCYSGLAAPLALFELGTSE